MTMTQADLTTIVKAQINRALNNFVDKHNKTHKTINIEFDLTDDKRSDDSFVLSLLLRLNGQGKLVYSKRVAHSDEAVLALWQDLLMNLVGMGIIFNLAEFAEQVEAIEDTTNEAGSV